MIVVGERYIDTSRKHRGLVVQVTKVNDLTVEFTYTNTNRYTQGMRFKRSHTSFIQTFAPLRDQKEIA